MKPRKYTDHYSIIVNLRMKVLMKKRSGNKPVINYNNIEVWDNYAKISDKHAPKIIEAVRTEKDSNTMQSKIDEIRLDIELEAFGITYERQSQGEKNKNRFKSSTEMNKI